MRKPLTSNLLLFSMIFSASPSVAGVIKIYFEGSVTNLTEFGKYRPLDGSIVPGTSINGSFSFEKPTPDPHKPTTGEAWYWNTDSSFHATIGNYSLTSQVAFSVWNDYLGQDQYSIYLDQTKPSLFTNGVDSFAGPSGGSDQDDGLFFYISIIDDNSNMFSSLALPSKPPRIDSLRQRSVLAVGNLDQTNYTNIDFTIESLSTKPIPEPSTIMLCSLGLLGLIGKFRKVTRYSTRT